MLAFLVIFTLCAQMTILLEMLIVLHSHIDAIILRQSSRCLISRNLKSLLSRIEPASDPAITSRMKLLLKATHNMSLILLLNQPNILRIWLVKI